MSLANDLNLAAFSTCSHPRPPLGPLASGTCNRRRAIARTGFIERGEVVLLFGAQPPCKLKVMEGAIRERGAT